jgi:hypothetical protein
VFGVVDESNWTVCKQRPKAGASGADQARLVVDRSCLSKEQETAGSENDPAQSGEESDSSDVAGEESQETFTMPSLVGSNLQDAQDRLQSLGSYVLDQEDASGLDRFQVLDANWKVCAQTPAAGTRTPTSAAVLLEAVKLHESCP